MDLKSKTAKELEKILSDVKKALANAQSRDRRFARKAAEKAAAEFGYSLGELTEGAAPTAKKRKAKGPKTKSVPKYANPSDPSQTWTGKGRQPNWYRAEIEKGTDPAKLEI
tara:strand:+ start:1911 stop:2243 length:333 start_codon:yes stop_codon:yes gene_type:complete